MPITAALLEALNQGISSGILIDTQVILYSHRDSAGRVRQPKALYASSHVLKTIPYFEDCKSTAALSTLEEPHMIGLQYSSGNSQSLSQRISRTQLTKKNVQRTMDTYPTVTLRTMKTIRPPRQNRRLSQRFNRLIPL